MPIDRTDEQTDDAQRRDGTIVRVHPRGRRVVLNRLVLVAPVAGRPPRHGRRAAAVCGSQTVFAPLRGAGAAPATEAQSRQIDTRLPAFTRERRFGDKKRMRPGRFSGDASLSHSRGRDATAPNGISATFYNG